MITMETWRLAAWIAGSVIFGYCIGRMTGYFKRYADADDALQEAINRLPKGDIMICSMVKTDRTEDGTEDTKDADPDGQ